MNRKKNPYICSLTDQRTSKHLILAKRPRSDRGLVKKEESSTEGIHMELQRENLRGKCGDEPKSHVGS